MVAKVARFAWPAVNPMASKAQLDHARKLQAASGYLDLEMPAHALKALDAIAHPEATPFEFYYLRGQALRIAGRFEEALVALSNAREKRPDDLDVMMAQAWCYKRTDQLPRAISTMEEAYRAHPKVPVVLYNIACYYALAGDKMQALSWLGRALRMEAGLQKLIADESDFNSLRNDPDFQYIAKLELLTDP
ncbi:MAG TPA: tetratricopeptide repeat protein [Planctomycetaceae bacterium]|nr:tetratricopeptide repeat protein [Planctomycetaceae bacterium]